MLKQSLEDAMKFAEEDMAKAKAGIAESAQIKASAEGDLDVTSKSLKADTESLADLHQECMTKAQDFEAETKSRGEELKALGVAKKAIEDNTAGAAKQSYGLSQVSLMQMSSGTDLASVEAVHYVRKFARKMKSTELAQLASRMSSAVQFGDPFEKVKGLITDMIERLESEAQADAEHKAYCDKELAESNAKKDDKTAEISKLTTKIDQSAARSAQLKEEVAGLNAALAALAKAGAEMDQMRKQEHEDYVQNSADMEQGLKGVKLALKILNDYYSKAGESGAGSGIIGMLEVIESDFTKTITEMVEAERTAAAMYEQQTKDNAITKTTKEQDVKYKTKEAAGLDKAVQELSTDRSGVQEELDATLQYLKSLDDKCTYKVESYAERKARREAEINGLKEALDILENETAFVQTRSLRGVRKHA